MKTRLFKIITLTITLVLFTTVSFSQSDMQEPLSGIENTQKYKSIDLIHMDKDLSIFANLLYLSGLNASLALTDQSHTLFVPTNEAFAEMTIKKFADLTDPKNRTNLISFVKRHFISTKINSRELTERKVITQGDGMTIPITESGAFTLVGGATIMKADVETANGVIHILNEAISVTRF